jgi:integrase
MRRIVRCMGENRDVAKKWTPTRRGDLVTRLVDGREIWYFDDYIQFDRFSPARRVRKSTMCLKADYERAKDVRDEIRLKLKAGDVELRRALTFAEWAPIWREKYEHERPLAASTVISHTQAVRSLLLFFGHKQMNQITDGDCLAYRRWRVKQPKMSNRGKPLPNTQTSAATVLTECHIAGAIWQCAVRAGKATVNPWRGIKLGAMPARTRVLSEEEQVRVLRAADPETVRFILIMLGTSFRVQALLDVPWEAVTVVETKNGPIAMIYVQSKGKMHAQALLPIIEQTVRDQMDWVRDNLPRARRLFPYTRSSIYKRLQKLAKAADVPRFSAHDIRRTFGTRSSETLSLDDTAMLLNNTPGIAAKHYIHADGGAEAVKKLRALSAMAPALLLPAVVTSVDSVGDTMLQTTEPSGDGV